MAILVSAEITLVAAYLAVTGVDIVSPRYVIYPFVWINVAAYGVLTVSPKVTNRELLPIGVLVGAMYFAVLAWLTGMIDLGHGGAFSLRISDAIPGWGPIIAVSGPIRLHLIPFETIGYLGLSYLVAVNAIAASRRLLSGVLGFATCVGCTVPVLTPVIGVLGGPTTGLASTAYAWSYDLGTLLFVIAAWLLLRGATAFDR